MQMVMMPGLMGAAARWDEESEAQCLDTIISTQERA